MQKALPFFPLSIVVFPGEILNLHVFEPRYKQLIHECAEHETTFGIPTFIDKVLSGMGTEIALLNIERVYDDGRMDIRTQGLQPFKILSFVNPIEGKLYAGGEVSIISRHPDLEPLQYGELLISLTKELHQYLNVDKELPDAFVADLSYQLGHKIGLSITQESQLLQIDSENTRREFLIAHLQAAIPIVREMERAKALIQMNGHFKHFDPLNF
ncbi:LON peptidase substrate-binding domain-containing protein [Eisenibacter elegans]|jgi:Lon protease-like protein|uniref:LON peptidase substrate-binding domain-containing protein n=1 Tax=Eisenibacter elegans TaxID=997 RepID=UPI00040617DD|nr:LON peptidase substrate-binding domain-containing protein [Eisenibacter elegans]